MSDCVVKVQVPQASTGPIDRNRCLIYDEDREHLTEQLVGADVKQALGRDPKGYFEASWAGSEWTLGQRVADQDW